MRQPGHLLRILGVSFGLAAVVGSMVGQGILRTPGLVAGAVHSPGWIAAAWVLGGLVAVIAAFAYVEMGVSHPCAGGPYEYAERAFGPVAGAMTGWTLLLAMIASVAGTDYVVGEYIVRLGAWPGVSPALPATFTMLLFWLLNMTGTRASGDIQILFSAAKGGILVALMVLLFMHRGGGAQVAAPPLQGAVGIAGFALAMRLIVSTYNGWQDIAVYGEELEAPEKSLPRSLFGGLAAVAVLYLLFNLALLHVLTPAQMAGSNLPAADALALVLGERASTALTVFSVLSVSAITSLGMMGTTRLAFALARGGMLPARLAVVAPNGTPRAALTFVALAALALVVTGTYDTLSSTSTSLYQVSVVVALACAIGLRIKEPDQPRPWRMPFYPWPVVIALIANFALLAAFVYDDPFNALIGLVLVVVMTLAWLGAKRLSDLPLET